MSDNDQANVSNNNVADGQQQEYIKLIGAEVNTRNLREVVNLVF